MREIKETNEKFILFKSLMHNGEKIKMEVVQEKAFSLSNYLIKIIYLITIIIILSYKIIKILKRKIHTIHN